MSKLDNITSLATIAALGIGGYFLYQKFNEMTNWAEDAGRATAQALKPVTDGWQYVSTTIRGNMEGFPDPIVPSTPIGMLPSNWSWNIGNGIIAGIPAGMTPGDFCRVSKGTSNLCNADGTWKGL